MAIGGTALLVGARALYTDRLSYAFILWNIFLAALPWAFSLLATHAFSRRKNVASTMWSAAWLLFFPNAPYILTDLIHMPSAGSPLWWYDQLILVGGVVAGLALGWFSWRRVGDILSARTSRHTSLVLSYLLLYVSAFGIYLGRFSRWNSWDVVRDPMALFADIADRFISPAAHPRTWAFTVIVGTVFSIGAWLTSYGRERRIA